MSTTVIRMYRYKYLKVAVFDGTIEKYFWLIIVRSTITAPTYFINDVSATNYVMTILPEGVIFGRLTSIKYLLLLVS